MKKICSFLLLTFSIPTFAQEWIQIAEGPIINSYEQTINNQDFGKAVSVDGDFAVVGSSGYDSNSGIAYVLQNISSEWKIVGKISPETPLVGGRFGDVVDISGDQIVVGHKYDNENGTSSGAAYIFEKPDSGWTDMNETAKLTVKNGGVFELFGSSVGIHNDVIVVGAIGAVIFDVEKEGAAYVFEKPTGGWTDMTETAKLTASDERLKVGFGCSIGISDQTIIVGSNYSDMNVSGSGAAYIYEKSTIHWTDQTEIIKIGSDDGQAGDLFGKSVSIYKSMIIIGSKNSGYVFETTSDTWLDVAQVAKLTKSDGDYNDNFGQSVDCFDNYVLIGAHTYDGTNISEGNAYLFEKPLTGWKNMTQSTKISPSKSIENNYFGHSVSISKENILIGAYGNSEFGSSVGAVYLYNRPISGWSNQTEDQQIDPPTENGNSKDYTGRSVAMDNKYAVIGAPGYMNEKGIAYIMELIDKEWETLAEIKASDGKIGDNFGFSVDLSGNTVIIGAYQSDDHGISSGSAYVFEKPESGWSDMTQTAKLVASDASSGDLFAYCIAISGNNIVVGAKLANTSGFDAGAAYVFEKPETGWVDMNETVKLLASDGQTKDYFGNSVDIYNDRIVVGAEGVDRDHSGDGAIYIFEKPTSGWSNISEDIKIIAPEKYSFNSYGAEVKVLENTIIVGAEHMGINSTAVFLYEKINNAWYDESRPPIELSRNVKSARGSFGTSLSITNDIIAIGDYWDNEKGDGAGAIYIFEKPINGWSDMGETYKIVSENSKASDHFGRSIAASGDFLITGAYKNSDRGFNSGKAYFFKGCISSINTEVIQNNNLLTASASNLKYQWVKCSNNSYETIFEETNQSFTAIETGEYAVEVWDGHCMQLSTCHNVDCSMIIDNSSLQNGIELEAVSSGYKYQWIDCSNNNTPIQEAIERKFIPTYAGEFAVEISNSTCSVQSICYEVSCDMIIDNSVSINEKQLFTNSIDMDYQWMSCNHDTLLVEGANDQYFSPSVSGSYAVDISNGSCVVRSDCYDITIIMNEDECMTIFPNPSSTSLNINLDNQNEVGIKLISTDGKVVRDFGKKKGIDIQLDIYGLLPAKYILFLENGKEKCKSNIIIN